MCRSLSEIVQSLLLTVVIICCRPSAWLAIPTIAEGAAGEPYPPATTGPCTSVVNDVTSVMPQPFHVGEVVVRDGQVHVQPRFVGNDDAGVEVGKDLLARCRQRRRDPEGHR